uniref:Zinc finger C2HC domain-containing protein 1A n=1 Tax=Plectus sambesii TaxID=2011161 RepID=A0A914WHZ6_9BILA
MANIPLDKFGPPPGEKTYPCKSCGRQFVKDSLGKHEPICKKMTKKQRKIFDSGVQRAVGADIRLQDIQKVRKEREKLGGVYPRPKTHWRERHEQFIEAVSASKQVDYALKTGTPLPPPPKSMVPSDFVKCEHCGRNFNKNAAERHIPFCKESKARNAPLKPPTGRGQPMRAQNGQVPKTPAQLGAAPTTRMGGREPTRDQRRSSTSDRRLSATRTGSSPAGRPTVTSAGAISKRTALPQPVKRSNSAPRTPAVGANHQSKLKPPPTGKPRTSRGKTPSPSRMKTGRPSETRQTVRTAVTRQNSRPTATSQTTRPPATSQTVRK